MPCSPDTAAALITLSSLPISATQKLRADARSSSPLRLTSHPRTFLGKLITPAHNTVFMLLIIGLPIAVAVNGGKQPAWMRAWALSTPQDSVHKMTMMRGIAGVAFLGVWRSMGWILEHLGSQFHYIARRESSKIVSTGPYAFVRHPMYTALLAQHVLLSLMFWSYIPLGALALSAGAFAIKVPIEEGIIEADPAVGEEYKRYKEDVRWKVIPFVW
ncbi:hypothetical protein HYDPIDRAFT_170138 [Hydnomerulius pinastri MD-312]|uniref:Protein-S-isoprenylcysteine O-methyltransferase n=1 Tax=Hydnomerulius pinastri MD-312 TaxID=994086 RepID=A0A0C9WB17_9AGAM|nr:hypothetical protein HYDPIDRAFT_170138 [Hydnomerulius pinastri MD-312]